MTDRTEIIEAQIAELGMQFFEREFYPELESVFATVLAKRRLSLQRGKHVEGEVIAVIGGSGSGKTTAVNRLLAPHMRRTPTTAEDARLSVAQINSPARATGKDVAIEALDALEYTAATTRSEGSLRLLLREHLQMRETLLLNIDEAQDLVRFQTPKEQERVVKFLKSLMVDKVWPIDLLLSGMPSLMETINNDPQLMRRATIVEVPRLLPTFDERDVLGIVHGYAAELPLQTSSDVNELVFAARLIHASDREFGSMIKYVLRAIRLALINEAAKLSCDHFAKAYQQKTNCPGVSNPFLEDDFERIDVRAWLRTDEEDDR